MDRKCRRNLWDPIEGTEQSRIIKKINKETGAMETTIGVKAESKTEEQPAKPKRKRKYTKFITKDEWKQQRMKYLCKWLLEDHGTDGSDSAAKEELAEIFNNRPAQGAGPLIR